MAHAQVGDDAAPKVWTMSGLASLATGSIEAKGNRRQTHKTLEVRCIEVSPKHVFLARSRNIR